MTPITAIAGIPAPASIQPAGQARPGGGFGEVFASAIRGVETAGQKASATVERFLSGDGEELHTVALEAQKAELTFELFLQARNKVVSAYQEIMRMQM